MKTTKLNTNPNQPIKNVHIDLAGLFPDLIDNVLNLEIPMFYVNWSPVAMQLADDFTEAEIDRAIELFQQELIKTQLAKLFAERMR